ncbi:MAG: ATP-dependent metallopeptidase FtsH/Yme1/Tma family protein [Candidatus Manganitrophus sp.]|nr:MAG: ATP-dependent metallopeptidase FtsH/Yme1/Tma family protein [Candidatus Manganitrophus sp.]
MPQKKEFPGWTLFVILFIVTVLPFFFFTPQARQTSYSDFKRLLREGKIKEVVISRDAIEGVKVEPSGKEEPFSTVRVDDPNLTSELEDQNVQVTGEIQSGWLRDIVLFWVLPFAVILFIWSLFARRMAGGGGGQGFMTFGRARAKVFAEKDIHVTFNDVAGVDEAKEELMEVVEFLREPQKFQRLGGKIPKGVLLVGPPGTGKTLLARAIAGEANVPFFTISGSDFVEMFVGVGASARARHVRAGEEERALHHLHRRNRRPGRPPSRRRVLGGGNDEREQTLNQLLVEMDGFERERGRHPHRGDQPSGRARSGAAAARPLRPADPGRSQSRPPRPGEDPQSSHAQGAAGRPT